ncbi:MAG: hypothetical protein WCD89_13660 [Anaerocolumna sp.]
MNENIKIGIIGNFDEKKPSHLATNEAIWHCADRLSLKAEIRWLPTKDLEGAINEVLRSVDALWCSPGIPYVSVPGAINAIRFAREKD